MLSGPLPSSEAPLGFFYSSGPIHALSAPVQAKFTIGKANDPFERQADAVAEHVVSGRKAPAITPIPAGGLGSAATLELKEEEEEKPPQTKLLQRVEEEPEEEGEETEPQAKPLQVKSKCPECEENRIQAKFNFPEIPKLEKAPPEPAAKTETDSGRQEKAEKAPGGEVASAGGEKGAGTRISLPELEPYVEEERVPPIQTKSRIDHGSTRGVSAASLENSLHTAKGGGSPLLPDVRSEMEQRFGGDLSHVRVHTDGASVQMNRDLRARAFTHEKDIYFNAGEYQPESQSGKHLLAHELAHTMQQGATSDRVQCYTAPAQNVVTEPKPVRPNDGDEVEARMNEKIKNDPDVRDPEDLSEEERQEAENPDRGEVRRESGEISNSGESRPTVDRGAEAQQKTETQKTLIEQQVQGQAAEAGEEKAGKGEGAPAPLSEADAAAQRALAAEEQAYSVPIPEQPQPFQHPKIKEPVDSAGESLPRNSQVDTQVRGLGYIGEMLRVKGYEMKRTAAEHEIASHALDSTLERQREDLANAKEGTATMEIHNEARKEIVEQSREAHKESVERQQFVAEKAPQLAGKADEGRKDSSELAGEARSKADRTQSQAPDDPDARADAEKQGGEMQNAAQGAQSMDQAIQQTGERARQYQQDAELAAEQNQQSEGQIAETEGVIEQTDARLQEMQATNAASQEKIENAGPGPALIRQNARQTAQSGDQLIAATVVMEQELNALQDQYLNDMAGIESRKTAIERQQKEQKEAADTKMSPEEAQIFELAGMDDKEQEQRIAEMSQPQRAGLLAALEGMIQRTPDQGTAASEGARLKVDTGLSKALTGEQPADPRQPQIQKVENRRIKRVGGVLDVADRNMSFVTEEQRQMLANRLVAQSVTDDIKNINILQMGKQMITGMIDPRQSLAGVVGGFEKMLTGFANIGNLEAWRRDPLGNLLQIAADISTGLAMVFSTILGIAGIILALMVALTIISWGFLSPITGPVIAWMGTIMTYAGWGAIIAGGLSVYFNYLSYIKNLHDAGTAKTARELFGNTEQMKQNASDGFQGAMAVVEGVGAVKMGPKLSSGKFFESVPRSPGAWASKTIKGAREGLSSIASAPGRIGRGARELFRGGRQGLQRFKERIKGLFGRRRPGGPDLELETPKARQRQQAHLDEARGKKVRDMEEPELRAEISESKANRPSRVKPDSEFFADYDIETKANGHTYRRRRDGRGWCRFSAEECFFNESPELRKRLGLDDLDLDDFLVHDPDLARLESRKQGRKKGGKQAQQEALSDIRKEGERPMPGLKEGLEAKRSLYMGDTPGKRSAPGKKVIERMRNEKPPRVIGVEPNEKVFVAGPDGKKRWYPIDETDMGHINPNDAVKWWNETGRKYGAKHPKVRKWMRDPSNYELEHGVVNRSRGASLGQEEQYLPPLI